MTEQPGLNAARADALARVLDLDVWSIGICHACLSFVVFALDDDDGGRRARREARRMAPDLWDEGLDAPALASLMRAKEAEVAGAREALEDAELNGGSGVIARAIVLRLAHDLRRQTRAELRLEALAREREPPDSLSLN